jgi:ParB family chromosome partitioning protein
LLPVAPVEGEALTEIPVDQVRVNPNQPRKSFDSNSLDDLTASIRSTGVIQPVIVRRDAGGYQLIAGERRWRAARQAGLGTIPAIVREATDAESLELALVENLLREDLNPMEEAEGYQRLLAQYGWTQEELSRRVGKDRSTIANSLRLLRLPELIQVDLRTGALTAGHARALLALSTPEEQLRLREQILAGAWSVRATEDSIRTLEAQRPRLSPARRGRRRSAELTALEEALQRALMTRVRVVGHERRGAIQIVYATAEELERLVARLGVRL